MMDIEFDALSLHLRKRQILNDVSGHFHKGTVTVILGPNGAGKSSLLSCLSGLQKPDAGTIKLGGRALLNWPNVERARRIGLLPQKADIHWDVNVRTLVGLGRLPHQNRWGQNADDIAAIDAAMTQTDCTHLADRTALRLSGGEQARVLLARVLAGKPSWILADEPLANLDMAHQLDAVECLHVAAKSGAGVVLVLHDLTLAARIADQIVIMKHGSIIASGSPGQVLTKQVIARAFDVFADISNDSNGNVVITSVSRVKS